MNEFWQKISEWAWHEIFLNDRVITKIPKKPLNIKEIWNLLLFAKDFFWKYILDTVIKSYWDKYILEQPFINWEHVSVDNLSQVLIEFEKLLELHSNSIIDNWIWLDFVWLEWAIKWWLYDLSKYKWTKFDYIIITPFLKKLSKTFSIFSKVYYFWEKWTLPELANVMIDTNWDLKVIDLSLINFKSNNLEEKVRANVIEWWNKYFLKKYFNIIY